MSPAGRTALMEAAAHGHDSCIRQLLKLGQADPRQGCEDTGAHPLLEAAMHNHLDAVKALLGNPGTKVNQVDKRGHSALLVAAR